MLSTYDVFVRGRLPEHVLDQLGAESSSEEPAQTVLRTGPTDQSALYGLLARLRALGLELVEVRRVPEAGDDSPPQASGT